MRAPATNTGGFVVAVVVPRFEREEAEMREVERRGSSSGSQLAPRGAWRCKRRCVKGEKRRRKWKQF